MKKNVVTALALVVAAISTASAQTPASVPPGQTPVAPVAAPAQSAPFHTAGPRVDLSIEEAVARAREKNIDIGVARITPRLTDFTIAGLEASYRLNLTSSGNNQRQTQLPRLSTQGISAPTIQNTLEIKR